MRGFVGGVHGRMSMQSCALSTGAARTISKRRAYRLERQEQCLPSDFVPTAPDTETLKAHHKKGSPVRELPPAGICQCLISDMLDMDQCDLIPLQVCLLSKRRTA